MIAPTPGLYLCSNYVVSHVLRGLPGPRFSPGASIRFYVGAYEVETFDAYQEEMERDARKSFFPGVKEDGAGKCWEIDGGFKVRTVTVT